jgi:hypothetical protein
MGLSSFPVLPRPPAGPHAIEALQCRKAEKQIGLNPPNRRMRTRMYGGVAREAGRPVPLCRYAPFPDSKNLRPDQDSTLYFPNMG